LIEPPYTLAEARDAGFELEDYETETLEVWPDNERAWHFFRSIGSRWVYGPSGRPIGFRWEAIYPLMDRAAPTSDEWDELRLQLEIMERAALDAHAEFYPIKQ
jgi:ribosomal protein S18 acetylase RimI-like enzyme